MSALQQIAYLLVEVVLDLYITAVVLRMLLGYVRANFYNPFSQFLVKITNPVLVPLRRFIPSLGTLDTSALVFAYGLKVLQTGLLVMIMGKSAGLISILWVALGALITLVIWIFIIAIILQSVMSWLGNAHANPIAPLLNNLTDPLLHPIRRYVSPIGGIDLSPLVAILGLQILLILVRSMGL